MTTRQPLIFFGNERLATGVTTQNFALRALLAAGYPVAAVIVNRRTSVSRRQRALEIELLAEENGIPLLDGKPRELLRPLEELRPVLGVLVAYGRIIPKELIDIFPKGIVNIHPSLLPLHRGPTPIESVILHGESSTGVSIMKLLPAMDAGPIYAISEVALRGDETKQGLADSLLEIGAQTLLETLPKILDGSIGLASQDDSQATYDELISKQDGDIAWSKPAIQLEREVRAYAGWPGSYTVLGGKRVIVTRARAISGSSNGQPGSLEVDKEAGVIRVSTGDGLLEIEKLKPAGRSEMTAAAFVAGLRGGL
jgi:methionyl-tRNA formyltransferase